MQGARDAIAERRYCHAVASCDEGIKLNADGSELNTRLIFNKGLAHQHLRQYMPAIAYSSMAASLTHLRKGKTHSIQHELVLEVAKVVRGERKDAGRRLSSEFGVCASMCVHVSHIAFH